jgi:hypothetical protein
MSDLISFESLEDFDRWKADDNDVSRRCPICDGNAGYCRHTYGEIRDVLEAAAKDHQQAKARAQAGEVRITDPSGGQKGQKLERFDLIPFDILTGLARLYGRGAVKYDDDNYRKGYRWRLSLGALMRHVSAWACGKSYDTVDGMKGGPIELDEQGRPVQTGEHHLICATWHCFTLIVFETHKIGTDDRAPTVTF